MGTKHLAKGSECPPKVDGKLRLYSMRFCPFVQRVKLVLNLKDIPYDVVDVNLKQKPEWLFTLHPEGKVPALDIGGKVLVESLDISDYLDEHYPEPPLYPADPDRKAEDKELISKFGKVISAITRAFYDKESKPLSVYMEEAIEVLQELEEELASRGTTFFGGDKPGMVDVMIWPWSERSKLPALLKNEEPKFPKEKFPKLVAWKAAMQASDPIKATILDQETHIKFLKEYLGGNPDTNFDF